MTFPPQPETGPMLFADCPFCDAPVVVDEATGAVVCETCAVHIAFADDVAAQDLPIAA